jgi:hypothetical protein
MVVGSVSENLLPDLRIAAGQFVPSERALSAKKDVRARFLSRFESKAYS